MPPLTDEEIANAEADMADLGAFMNADETTNIPTRYGGIIPSLRKLLAGIAAAPPLGWLDIFSGTELRGAKGDPGGNIMAIGLFAALAGISVPAGTTLVQTSGNAATGRGQALYIEDTSLVDADVAAHPRTIGKSSNGRFFRLAPDQIWHLAMFGTIGDGDVANAATNYAALQGMKSYVAKYERTGVGYGTAGHSIWWGYNDVHIGANTFDLDDVELVILCESGGGTAAGASIIRTNGTTAVRIQNADTTGATGTRTATLAGAGGSYIHGLTAVSNGAGTEGAVHGFHLRGGGSLIACAAYYFPGNGFHIEASATLAIKGNANGSFLQQCFAQGNLHGFYFSGDDANACTITHCSAIANKQWGFWDKVFVGNNTYTGNHAAANGWDGAIASVPTACTYAGNRYFPQPNMAASASVTAPSGTTADTPEWGYMGAGGTYYGVAPWVSGMAIREGGGYKSSNPSATNTYNSNYTEGDQNPPQIIAPSLINGGILAITNRGSALAIHSDNGGNAVFSPGAVFQNRTPNAGCTVTFQNTTLAGGVNVNGYIDDLTLAGLRIFGKTYLEFHLITGGRIYYLDAGGIKLEAGMTVSINNKKVLDSRGVKGAAGLAEVVACLDHHGLWE